RIEQAVRSLVAHLESIFAETGFVDGAIARPGPLPLQHHAVEREMFLGCAAGVKVVDAQGAHSLAFGHRRGAKRYHDYSNHLMSNIHTPIDPQLWDYIRCVSLREHDVLRRLREATASHPQVSCQIAPEQGQFMQLLMHLIGATRTLEIGVFTGYSSTAV